MTVANLVVGIMMEKAEQGIDWRPDLKGKDLDEYERLRAELAPQISLMRKLRSAMGLSQAEVAELLGTTQSRVSKIEARSEPKLSAIARMATAKGATVRLVVQTKTGDELSFNVEG